MGKAREMQRVRQIPKLLQNKQLWNKSTHALPVVSQNHRMFVVGRDLFGSSSPTP